MSLGVDPALPDCVRHAINRQHVGGDAVVHAMGLGIANDIVERRFHDGFELLVHDRLFPEIALPVLHPLEVGSGDAAGVGENVGNYKHAFLAENVIGGGRGRPIGAFGQNAALHAVDVAAGDDILRRGRNQNLALGREQVGGLGFLRLREAMHRAVFLPEFNQRLYIDPVLIVQTPTHFCDANHFIAVFVHQERGVGADVAEALHDHTGAAAVNAQLPAGLVANDHYAAAGGLAPAT